MNGHDHGPNPLHADRSGFFPFVLKRKSGKYLTGTLWGKSFWSDDPHQAMRMFDIKFAGSLAASLSDVGSAMIGIADIRQIMATEIISRRV